MVEKSSKIPRYLLVQCLVGCLAGLLIVAVILWTDTGGVGSLIAASSEPLTVLAILVVGSLTTTVPLVVATAIGLLAWQDGQGKAWQSFDRGKPSPALRTVPSERRRRR